VTLPGLADAVATVGEGDDGRGVRRELEGAVKAAAGGAAAALSETTSTTGRGGMLGGEGDVGDGEEDEGTAVEGL
jgi:hypothetical protein